MGVGELKMSMGCLSKPMKPVPHTTAIKAVTRGRIKPCLVRKASKCSRPISTRAMGNNQSMRLANFSVWSR